MNRKSIFLPDYRFSNLSVIDTSLFLGSDLIIFDVDNTLVFPGTTKTKEEVKSWFLEINKRYNCVCVSNSRTINKRGEKISGLLGCKIFYNKIKKPFKKLFRDIKKEYSLSESKIIVIGDRVFPDVLFGNLNNAITILIDPLTEKESFLEKQLRKLENFILNNNKLKSNK